MSNRLSRLHPPKGTATLPGHWHRLFTVALGAGVLALSACAPTPVASHESAAEARAKQAARNDPTKLGNDAPNPAREEMDGDQFARYQGIKTKDM